MYYNGTRIKTVKGIWSTFFIMLTVVGTVEDHISAIRSKGRYTPSGCVSQLVEVTALNRVNLSHVAQHFLSSATRSCIKHVRTEAPKEYFITCFHSSLSVYRFKAFITLTTEVESKALTHTSQGCNNQVTQTQALPAQITTSRIRAAWGNSSLLRAGISGN